MHFDSVEWAEKTLVGNRGAKIGGWGGGGVFSKETTAQPNVVSFIFVNQGPSILQAIRFMSSSATTLFIFQQVTSRFRF